MSERSADRLEALEVLAQSVVRLAEITLAEVRALRAEAAAEEFVFVGAEPAPAAAAEAAASAPAASPAAAPEEGAPTAPAAGPAPVGVPTAPAGSARSRYWLLTGAAPGSRVVGAGLYGSARAANAALAKLPAGANKSTGVPNLEAGRRAWYAHVGTGGPPLPRH